MRHAHRFVEFFTPRSHRFGFDLFGMLSAGCPPVSNAECTVSSDCAADEICNASGVCENESTPDPTEDPDAGVVADHVTASLAQIKAPVR
ncbi:MAG: hypothetical protein GY822_17975 [Deltaproteobacteria bacterium]|nr:hypothetical protein [Deltaproteobacteria bacterium]